jgi:DNA-nicking Smr family endonuclease
MPRRLGADEEALWSRVAATVRPLGGRSRLTQRPLPVLAARAPDVPEPRKLSKQAAKAPVAAATLDGHWDRRMMKGRMAPERVLDLHGFGRDVAHDALTHAIQSAAIDGVRVLLVVTGKGSREGGGVLRAQLPHWLEAPGLRPYIAALRPAHPRHGGGGAWYVIVRRGR